MRWPACSDEQAAFEDFLASCTAEERGNMSLRGLEHAQELLPFVWEQQEQLPDLLARGPGDETDSDDEARG